MRLIIYPNGRLVVTVPRRTSLKTLEGFLFSNADWIMARISDTDRTGSLADFKTQALAFVNDKIANYNRFYNFNYQRIAIKDQQTRWGSCSRQGNLNFNYRILFLPSRVADYVIVHELCHLNQLNHSQQFWRLVERTFPDYRELRKALKRGGLSDLKPLI